VKKVQEFVNKQGIMDNILNVSQSEVESLGVSRSRFQGIKQRIRDGNLNLNTPAVRGLT
jgi:anti-sigma28 factor (negative regulator of flagellin synthesis)